MSDDEAVVAVIGVVCSSYVPQWHEIRLSPFCSYRAWSPPPAVCHLVPVSPCYRGNVKVDPYALGVHVSPRWMAFRFGHPKQTTTRTFFA